VRNCVGPMFALLCGVLLLAGCRTESKQPAPGALPTGRVADVTPRLNASTYFAHGHLLERQGDYEHAIQQYRQALALKPDFLSARNRLAIALNKLGRHGEATREFRQAVAQDPTQAYLYNNLGFSLYLENRYQEAADVLRHALELRPDYARARMNYGVVLARLGQYDQALAEFTLATSQADAYYNLGVIQTDLGDYAAAARSLESALSLDPGFDVARQQLHEVARLAATQSPMAVPASSARMAQAEPPSQGLAPGAAASAEAAGLELAASRDLTVRPQAEEPPAPGTTARMTVAQVEAAIRAALAEAGRIPANTPSELIPPELRSGVKHEPAGGAAKSAAAEFFGLLDTLRARTNDLVSIVLKCVESLNTQAAPEASGPASGGTDSRSSTSDAP